MMFFRTLAAAAALTAATTAGAAITYDANVTNAVIFGSGVTNGSFTVDRSGALELGLRGKVRYDVADDQPKNVFNSNGDGTYNHAAGGPAAAPSRSRWNFEWSVNSNYNGQGGNLAGLTYTLGMDFDRSAAKDYKTLDLLSTPLFDHSFGNNGTAMGAGVEGNAQTLALNNNLMQNSWSLDFFDTPSLMPLIPGTFNPNLDGEYSFFLEARGATSGALLGRTEITIIVGDGATVPEPGTLALVGLAMIGGFAARRRMR